MRKTTALSLFIITFFFYIPSVVAQKNVIPPHRTCATAIPDAGWETWFSARVKDYNTSKGLHRPLLTSYTIPVIIHILHNGDAVGVNENISLAQAQSQIAILNDDYGGTNADIVKVPSVFQAAKGGNSGIQFCLAKIDPNGTVLAEPGVERINWQTRGWTNPNTLTKNSLPTYFDGTIKPASIWDPTKYLNVWVAQVDNSGLLGYASFPAASGLTGLSGVETATTSGVVINKIGWGNTGTATAPYNKGRTATHEIGHWLGLRHIWGDGSCATDYCSDTPPAEDYNDGCPIHPSNVGGCTGNTTGEMFMDYMDYSNDACMYMFTANQVARMQTAMANGTYRKTLSSSTACQDPVASYCSGTTNLTGESGTFSDGSGAANYTNNANCMWSIAPPGANQIVLNFTSVNVEADYDSLIVYDGPDDSYPVLLAWSGTTLPPAVTSTAGALCVKFKSDIEVTGAGWTATYTSTGIVPGCDGPNLLTIATGTFTDGSGASSYGNNQLCSWLIAPPCATSITLSLTQLDTEADYDGIIVYDGNSTDATVLGAFSGTTIPSAITSSGGEMLVVFISDFSTPADGFSANYTSTGAAYCSGTTTLNVTATGSFSDGSGNNNYCNNMNCRWLIQPPNATSITVSFNAFNTETDFDKVIVYNGPGDTYPILGTFSGTSIPSSVTSTSGSMFVKFVTDEAVNAAGWSAGYTSSSIYTFTGNGSWTIPANWLNNLVQPATVPNGVEVIIDPIISGECIYTGTIIFAPGSKLTIKQTKKLTVNGNLIMQ